MAETITLAGWLETRYSKRRDLWQIRLRHRPSGMKTQNAAEVWVRAADETEARTLGADQLLEKRLALTRRLARRNLPRSNRGSLQLGAFYSEVWYERVYPKLPANSQADHDQQWPKWVAPFISGFSLSELAEDGPAIGQFWIEQLKRDGAGVPTIHKVVNMARGYLTKAREWGYLTDPGGNPFRYVELPKVEFVEESEYALEIEQVELLAWLTPGPLRNTLWMELIGCEALRQQELVCLRWIDLFHPDWSPRDYMEVTKAVSGQGRKREIKTLKNPSEGRRNPDLWLPVLPLAEAVRAEEQVTDLDSFVFGTDSWDRLPDMSNWRDDVWSRSLALSMIEQDGIYGHLTPHRLRGAAASAFGYALAPQHTVMMFCGHKQETTTLTWYLRAYKNPKPELRGMHFAAQVERARALILRRIRERVGELEVEVERYRALGLVASTKNDALRHGAFRANRERDLVHARRKAELLTDLVG